MNNKNSHTSFHFSFLLKVTMMWVFFWLNTYSPFHSDKYLRNNSSFWNEYGYLITVLFSVNQPWEATGMGSDFYTNIPHLTNYSLYDSNLSIDSGSYCLIMLDSCCVFKGACCKSNILKPKLLFYIVNCNAIIT